MKNPFARDPVLTLNLVAALIYGASLIFANLTVEAQGWLNAIAVLVLNLIAAGFVRAEEWVPIVTGLFKALFALIIALGLHWAPESQAATMLLITAVLAFIARTQTVAPVDINGQPVPRTTQPLAA
jgi:uncharacterized membrane protein YoaK (UPF0700 family)